MIIKRYIFKSKILIVLIALFTDCLIPNYSNIDIIKINPDQSNTQVFLDESILSVSCAGSNVEVNKEWEVYFTKKFKNKLTESGYEVVSDKRKSDINIELFVSKCNNFCEYCDKKNDTLVSINNTKKLVSLISLGIIPVVIYREKFYLHMQIEETRGKKNYRIPLRIRDQYFLSIFYIPFILLPNEKRKNFENWDFYIDQLVIFLKDRKLIKLN